MPKQLKAILFVCFFLSGFCGLLYQIVWLRLAYASFGIVTPVLSVVVSMFMAGLCIGSVLAGKLAVAASKKTHVSAIQLYGVTELLIGVGGVAVPFLYSFSEQLLLHAGSSDSFSYLALSAVCVAISILPWCILMGCTYPLMLTFVKQRESDSSFFGFLYWANVMGATAGVLISAFVMIELLGFRNSLAVGATLNAAVAALAFYVSRAFPVTTLEEKCDEISAEQTANKSEPTQLLLLFASGFCSMAMEVVWSRAFMPVLGTAIYSFALLLFVYLLSTALGSRHYLRDKAAGKAMSVSFLLSTTAFCAFMPVILNGFQPESIYISPNLADMGLRSFLSLFSIAPFCFFLGYLTPKLIDDISHGLPESAGNSYAINSIGCIVGPLVASYLLLPQLGARISHLILNLVFVLIASWFLKSEKNPKWMLQTACMLGLLGVGAFLCGSYDEPKLPDAKIYRDHVGTVLVYTRDNEKQLMVNGRSMTNVRAFLKMMAHYPIVLHKGPVKKSLVICLGMGTTFRSLMSWNQNETKAVELVPGVKAALPNFYTDVNDKMQNIIVDDGRRFLKRSNEKFDLITLDPPPPVEAAGSSLLYTKEFTQVLKEHLNPDGILQHWFPNDEMKVLSAVAESLKENFKYVRVFQSSEGWGYHFICSDTPIEIPSMDEIKAKLSETVIADIKEGAEPYDKAHPEAPFERIIEFEIPLADILKEKMPAITDDRPINEYCVIRRIATGKPEEWHSVKIQKSKKQAAAAEAEKSKNEQQTH